MILDNVDFNFTASIFQLRSYKGCSPGSIKSLRSKAQRNPEATHRNKDLFKLARDRRQQEDEEARLKLAEQGARTRIRQFENRCRRKKTFDIPEPKKPSDTSDVDSAVFVVESPRKDISQAEIIATIVSKWRARARWSKVIREVRSMSLSNSDASPSRQPSPGSHDLLYPVTPSRTRASSASSAKIASPCNSDTSLLRHSSPVPTDLLSPLTPTRARAASTGSIRLVVDSGDC